MKFGDGNMCLEFFLSPWNHGARPAGRAPFDTAVRCRLGTIQTDGDAAVWHLLGGVPLPPASATSQDRELRLSIALARAPAELVRVLGPVALSRLQLASPIGGPAGSAEFEEDDALEMMWRVTREDVTVYSRASAPPELWLSLLQSLPDAELGFSTQAAPPLWRSPNEVVSLAVAIAAGNLTGAQLARLKPGDVVRMPTSFDTAGRGRLRLGEHEFEVRWRTRSPEHVFELIAPAAPLAAAPQGDHGTDEDPGPTLEFLNMNDDTGAPHPHSDPSDDRASNDYLDFGQEGSQGWSEVMPAQASEGAPSGLSGMQVTLVAEIGTLTMTLGALAELKPGALIKLSGRGEDEVVLRGVGGPPVAYAELVDIGGYLGMQVTRIART